MTINGGFATERGSSHVLWGVVEMRRRIFRRGRQILDVCLMYNRGSNGIDSQF